MAGATGFAARRHRAIMISYLFMPASNRDSSISERIPQKRFHVILVKPSKYDDEGYVIRWLRGIITSSSLACLYALTRNAAANGALPAEVETVVHCFDETVQKIPVGRLSGQILRSGERGVACMVGVQTNQYARSLDLALEFKKAGISAMIGGFHVSGCMAMLPDHPPEIQKAIDEGITLVAGEVERRWPELLRDAYENKLESIYNFLSDKPALMGVPEPELPKATMARFLNRLTSFDAGRGCPFHCSFCSIINIQGNTMRGRSADDIEKIVRHNFAAGARQFFIADDNFARHENWESIADRLIDLKENHGIQCSLMIQTDAAAHRIPRFIEKMAHAGVERVFLGLESVNPDNLRTTGKHQNQLKEYRAMLLEWRDHGVLTHSGYIVGFPGDTYDSIMRDVEFLKNEIPLDLAEFFILTPAPGSKDHQKYYLEKVWLEPDTNKYDGMHVCVDHPRMTHEELLKAYHDAWKSFYSREHLRRLLLRCKGSKDRIPFSSLVWFCNSVFLTRIHPLMGGFYRIKSRKERRPGMPEENAVRFHTKRAVETITYTFGLMKTIFDVWRVVREARKPENADYMDRAIEPVVEAPPTQKADSAVPRSN